MEKIYSVSEFAEMIGKSVNTLQRWDRLGILTSYRSPMNRRYYNHSQYNEYMGITKSEDKKNVIYTRVSNIGQKDGLIKQIEFIENYTKNHGIPISDRYSEIVLVGKYLISIYLITIDLLDLDMIGYVHC